MNAYFSDKHFHFSDKYAERMNKIFLLDFFQGKIIDIK